MANSDEMVAIDIVIEDDDTSTVSFECTNDMVIGTSTPECNPSNEFLILNNEPSKKNKDKKSVKKKGAKKLNKSANLSDNSLTLVVNDGNNKNVNDFCDKTIVNFEIQVKDSCNINEDNSTTNVNDDFSDKNKVKSITNVNDSSNKNKENSTTNENDSSSETKVNYSLNVNNSNDISIVNSTSCVNEVLLEDKGNAVKIPISECTKLESNDSDEKTDSKLFPPTFITLPTGISSTIKEYSNNTIIDKNVSQNDQHTLNYVDESPSLEEKSNLFTITNLNEIVGTENVIKIEEKIKPSQDNSNLMLNTTDFKDETNKPRQENTLDKGEGLPEKVKAQEDCCGVKNCDDKQQTIPESLSSSSNTLVNNGNEMQCDSPKMQAFPHENFTKVDGAGGTSSFEDHNVANSVENININDAVDEQFNKQEMRLPSADDNIVEKKDFHHTDSSTVKAETDEDKDHSGNMSSFNKISGTEISEDNVVGSLTEKSGQEYFAAKRKHDAETSDSNSKRKTEERETINDIICDSSKFESSQNDQMERSTPKRSRWGSPKNADHFNLEFSDNAEEMMGFSWGGNQRGNRNRKNGRSRNEEFRTNNRRNRHKNKRNEQYVADEDRDYKNNNHHHSKSSDVMHNNHQHPKSSDVMHNNHQHPKSSDVMHNNHHHQKSSDVMHNNQHHPKSSDVMHNNHHHQKSGDVMHNKKSIINDSRIPGLDDHRSIHCYDNTSDSSFSSLKSPDSKKRVNNKKDRRQSSHKRKYSEKSEDYRSKRGKNVPANLTDEEIKIWEKIERIRGIPKYSYIGEFDSDRSFMMGEEDKACQILGNYVRVKRNDDGRVVYVCELCENTLKTRILMDEHSRNKQHTRKKSAADKVKRKTVLEDARTPPPPPETEEKQEVDDQPIIEVLKELSNCWVNNEQDYELALTVVCSLLTNLTEHDKRHGNTDNYKMLTEALKISDSVKRRLFPKPTESSQTLPNVTSSPSTSQHPPNYPVMNAAVPYPQQYGYANYYPSSTQQGPQAPNNLTNNQYYNNYPQPPNNFSPYQPGYSNQFQRF